MTDSCLSIIYYSYYLFIVYHMHLGYHDWTFSHPKVYLSCNAMRIRCTITNTTFIVVNMMTVCRPSAVLIIFISMISEEVYSSSVSLTVEGGMSLVGEYCPGTVRLFCEGVDLTQLEWRLYQAENMYFSRPFCLIVWMRQEISQFWPPHLLNLFECHKIEFLKFLRISHQFLL